MKSERYGGASGDFRALSQATPPLTWTAPQTSLAIILDARYYN